MKILMVCLGNICRSPLAEEIMRSKLPADFSVDSAGTLSNNSGKAPDERSKKTAENHGLDISAQRSRQITAEDFENFDKIYCMDASVLEDVKKLTDQPEHHHKIHLLLEEAGKPTENQEVPDPFWSDLPYFEEIYQILDEACERIAHKIVS